MKSKLQSILRSTFPSPLFVRTCLLLFVLAAICWAAAEKVSRDADARMRPLMQPFGKPVDVAQSMR